MSNVYIRIPHYIASFLRNRSENEPIAKGEPIVITNGDPLLAQIEFLSEANLRGEVNIDCLSERQWSAMMQGKYIKMKDGFCFDMSRNRNDSLSLYEIYTLTGNEHRIKYEDDGITPLPDSEYSEEYVPFKMPYSIYRNKRNVKVQSDWYIPNVVPIISELRERFKCALAKFVSIDRTIAHTLSINRSRMESIDRFLLRYDIRTGDKEREQMKKLLSRSIQAALRSVESNNDHARWSQEHIGITIRENGNKRPVVVLETGEKFPSLTDFTMRYGGSKSNLVNCINKGYKCRGLHVIYADTK